LQWLAETCVRRPVLAVMIIAAMVVAGAASFPQLGTDRYPSLDLPTISVRTVYTGASPEEVESEVSQVLEDAVATVAGIDELRSISSEGTSILLVTFDLNRNLDSATQDVRDAVQSVLNRLPTEIDPPVVRKQDTESSPILTLTVAGPLSDRELFLLADKYVKDVIESAAGVGQVVIGGSAERAVQIEVDAQRLASYGLSIVEIRDAIARQNTEVPSGRVDTGPRELSLRTLGRVPNAKQFSDLVVATIRGVPIRLSDVAKVTDGQKEVRTLARFDGRPAVVLEVQRQSGSNTVEVIHSVKERLERSKKLLPEGVEVSILQDQSRYIEAALHEIQTHLIFGSLWACLTVMAFMRSWRSTIIAGIAIPTSLVATFAVMKAFNFTLNNVTMLALVLMVGVVIDDAIVVLENIFRFIEEKGRPPFEAAIEATQEIGLAVLATTISLVIVFLPVSFLSSVTGRMLFQFGVTATAAIMVSLVVSFVLTPMLCSRMLRPAKEPTGEHSHGSRGGIYGMVENSYIWMLSWCLRLRWLVLAGCVGLVLVNWPLYSRVKQDYLPTNVDESEFELSILAPEGTSVASMNSVLKAVEGELLEVKGIEHVMLAVGTRDMSRVNQATGYVRLADIEGRVFSLTRLWNGLLKWDPQAAFRGNYTQRDKMVEVRKRLKRFKECRTQVRNLTSLRQGAPVDIDFSITGANFKELLSFSEKLRQKVGEIPGIVDVDTTIRMDKPELRANIDRELSAAMGVSVRDIADTLRIAVGGDDRVSRYRDPTVDDVYDVELRLVNVDRDDPESISNLYVPTDPSSARLATGAAPGRREAKTRISNLVRFERAENVSRIDRLERQRMVAIRANISPGFALGDRLEEIEKAAKEIGIPAGFETRVLGRGRELERTLSDFGWTFALSFAFMYIVLAAQYEHFVHPLTILFSLPLTVPFGLLSLLWADETLNLYSALGILVLFGVVKKAAILQVDHTNALRARGMPRDEAVLQANRDRLRPILMTTVAFVAGMLPLLLGTGPGAEERRSIAVLAVGGQTLSLLPTLLAVPVVYCFFDDVGIWVSWLLSRRRRDVVAQPVEPAVLTHSAYATPLVDEAELEAEEEPVAGLPR
jgi:HAE1 family hydrophobic/amphiphilic exporter-1